jgi:hypothetical protein
VTAYSLISLFSFFNVSYVRDFDALQVNIVPIALTLISFLHLQHTGLEYGIAGITLTLFADAYLGQRYKENSDKIDFYLYEMFSRESWTAQAYEKESQLGTQLMAVFLIFAQIFVTLCGAINAQGYCLLFLAFYLARLSQFFFKTVLGIQMAQSNMTCVVLATMGCFTFNAGIYSMIATCVLLVDSYIGLMLFSYAHREDMSAYSSNIWSLKSKLFTSQRLDTIEDGFSKV